MNWLLTWGGRSFGFREQDDLFTYKGAHVGRFQGDEVFAPDGSYLGELYQGRLIRCRAKVASKSARWSASMGYAAVAPYAGDRGFIMLQGYEDFPRLEGEG